MGLVPTTVNGPGLGLCALAALVIRCPSLTRWRLPCPWRSCPYQRSTLPGGHVVLQDTQIDEEAPPKPQGAARLPSGTRHTPPAATHALRGGLLAHEHPILWSALPHPGTRERATTAEAGRSGSSSRRGTVLQGQDTTAGGSCPCAQREHAPGHVPSHRYINP